MDAKAIGERIHSLIKGKKMTAREFAQKTNLHESALTGYKKGEYAPSAEALINISEYFNITIDWLLTGKGTMYKTPAKDEQPLIEHLQQIEPVKLPVEEETFLDNYRDMTDEGKRAAQKAIKRLRDQYREPSADLSSSDEKMDAERTNAM